MKIIMTPMGSHGDVHPFVGIGRSLRQRGHEVIVFTSEPFRKLVEQSGLQAQTLSTIEDFEKLTGDPDLWHPRRGIGVVLRRVAERSREAYERLTQLYEPGRTVLVNHLLSVPARVFEEKRHAAAVTLSLAPSAFRTQYQIPAPMAGQDWTRAPRWVKRVLWWLVDHWLLDRHIEPMLNRWRQELSLPKVHRIFQHWVHSPNMTIGLFPDWFAKPQPDWPTSLRLTGFPLFDEASLHETDDQLNRFLDTDQPPIVFTPGSANRQAVDFFTAAADAVRSIDRRALFLTRYPQQLPARLPETIMHRSYIPLSQVLPRCAALVHHGGIGTCAQGLAAGVPQLVMPMGFDQPDNVTRLHRLGVGAWVAPKRFTGKRVAAALQRLLGSSDVARACDRWSSRVRQSEAIEQTCQLIEQAGQRGIDAAAAR